MAYAGMYTYKDPTTGKEFAYGDPTINRAAIEGRGLTFVQGPTGSEADPLAALRQGESKAEPSIARYTSPSTEAPKLFPEAGRTFGAGDEEAIRETERKRVQSAIDAINESIANELSRARQAGLGRLGRTRAMGAAFGLAGSPTGEAQRQETERLNIAEEREIEASRRLQIETVLGRADNRAAQEIIARRQLAQTNQEKYLEFLGKQKEEARKDIEVLAKTGAKVEKNTEVYNRLLTQSGYDPLSFDSILNYYRDEASKIKYEHVYDSNTGELTLFGIDPKTQQPVFKKYKTDMAQGEVFKEIDGVPYAQKKDAEGNISLRKLEGFTPSAEKALDLEKKRLDIEKAKQDIEKAKREAVGTTLDIDIDDPKYLEKLMDSTKGRKKPNQVETIRPIQKSIAVINQLQDLQTSIAKTNTDPILGTLRTYNPYDFDARVIQAQLQAVVPNLARGVYGEVGVLTDNDIKNYIQTLPNIKGTEAQNKFVMAMTLKTVQRNLESQLETLASAGYDISGFKNQVSKVQKTVSTMEADLGISQTNEAGAGEERIVVINPDGQEGTIPAGQLDEALKSGYKKK